MISVIYAKERKNIVRRRSLHHMLFGQSYNGKGRISNLADYVQFNICGLNSIEVVQRYFMYKINKPIVLLGDYYSEIRNTTEDDMLKASRIYEIKEIIKSLKAFGAEILGITFQPVTRNGLKAFGEKVTFEEYAKKINDIYDIPVFIKNRYNKEIFLSTPEEIIEFSKKFKTAIDGQLLFKTCEANEKLFIDTLRKINWENVWKYHLKCVSVLEDKYSIDFNLSHKGKKELMSYIKRVEYITFMIGKGTGGGAPEFEAIAKKLFDIDSF
jgi:hypothetical protein